MWEKIKKLLASFEHTTTIEVEKIAHEIFVVLDFETTGINPAKDSIVEACLLPVKDNTIVIRDQLYLQIQSDNELNRAATIHGLLPSDGTADRRKGLLEIARCLHGKWMVGHYVDLDYQILKVQCEEHGIRLTIKGLLDTQKMAIKLDKATTLLQEIEPRKYSLSSLCKIYGIPLEDEHTAAGDALATAVLFVKLINLYKKRKLMIPVTRFE